MKKYFIRVYNSKEQNQLIFSSTFEEVKSLLNDNFYCFVDAVRCQRFGTEEDAKEEENLRIETILVLHFLKIIFEKGAHIGGHNNQPYHSRLFLDEVPDKDSEEFLMALCKIKELLSNE